MINMQGALAATAHRGLCGIASNAVIKIRRCGMIEVFGTTVVTRRCVGKTQVQGVAGNCQP